MSCLVSPHGWRLYFTKYWKSNYTISKKFYPLSLHTSRIIFALVESVLETIEARLYDKKNFFKFATFKLLFFHDTIYLLVKYKMYWRSIRREFFFQLSRRMVRTRLKRFRGRRYKNVGPRRSKNPLLRLVRKRKIQLLRRPRRPYSARNYRLSRAAIRHKKLLRRGKRIFLQPQVSNFKKSRPPRELRRLFHFLFILPIFFFLKRFFAVSIRKLVPSRPNVKSIFYGLNKKNFNILDILDVVDIYIRQKRFSTTKTLYTLLKVLKKLSRRQKLAGFKFLLAGRFTRRDRATYVWKAYGAVTLGSRMTNIEYFSFPMFLNYSKCIARLWICRS